MTARRPTQSEAGTKGVQCVKTAGWAALGAQLARRVMQRPGGTQRKDDMSLDVYLTDEAGNEVYSRNITHNLGKMAAEAGIYMHLWRPDENGITHARQIIEPLTAGLALMATEKKRFEALNAANGWGKWEHFVPWCADYLQACKDNPDAMVRVSR